jgi:hypothetical protein
MFKRAVSNIILGNCLYSRLGFPIALPTIEAASFMEMSR